MRPFTIVAVYFVVWWIVIFLVLPFGVRTQDEAGEVTLGTTASAPVRPRLVRVAIATTIVSAIIVFVFWVLADVYGVTLETVAHLLDGK